MSLLAFLLLQASGPVISPPLPPTPPPAATGLENVRQQGREAVLRQLFLVQLGSPAAVTRLMAEAKTIPVSGSNDSTDLASYYTKEFMAENSRLGWFKCNADGFELTGIVNCELFAGSVGQRVDRSRPTHRLAYTIKDQKVLKVDEISSMVAERG